MGVEWGASWLPTPCLPCLRHALARPSPPLTAPVVCSCLSIRLNRLFHRTFCSPYLTQVRKGETRSSEAVLRREKRLREMMADVLKEDRKV